MAPRDGLEPLTQPEEPKAAAITAQRAGDIVTREGQPHLYIALDGPGVWGQKVWPPGPLIEDDAGTGTGTGTGIWQMLAPAADTDCDVFGTNDLISDSGWSGGRVDPEGDYVWTLWRPYQCCRRRGWWFLADIDLLGDPL